MNNTNPNDYAIGQNTISDTPAPTNTSPIPQKTNFNKIIFIILSVIIVGLISTVAILAYSVNTLMNTVNNKTANPTATIAPTETIVPTHTPTPSSTPTVIPTLKPTVKPTAKPTATTTPTPTTEPGDVKPIVYLYPQHSQLVNVQLQYKGVFTVTYPEYNNGWNVIANPDGKLLNLADLKEYSYLFWEGIDKDATYDLTTGFVVKGEDAAAFLQSKLAELGLTPREYNEFIVYWLPKMLDNKYNLVHFASQSEYADRAVLNVNPKPDSVLRVFMILQPLENKITIKPQIITPFERKGFAVIEWGGKNLE